MEDVIVDPDLIRLVVVVLIPVRRIPDVMNVGHGRLFVTRRDTRGDPSPLHEEGVVRSRLIATNDAIVMDESRHETKKEEDLFPDPPSITDNVHVGLHPLVHPETRSAISILDPPSIKS